MWRRVRTILVFPLMGAVVNVAVAWGCHLWSNARTSQLYPSGYDFTAEWANRPADLWTSEPTEFDGEEYSGFGMSCYLLHAVSWLPGDTDKPYTSKGPANRTVYASFSKRFGEAGLPLRSFSCLIWSSPSSCVSSGTVPVFGRHMPIRPVWPGILVNTVLYAVILWVSTIGAVALHRFTFRHHIRRKRGLCPMCGYDLRGELDAGCSECGWVRASSEGE